MPIEAGTQLGPWLVREYIGQGETGVVFRVQGPDGTVAAIKVLKGFQYADARARLRGLAWRLVRLHHPNLLPVLDAGEYEQVPFLVFDYVAGGSLEHQLQLGRPPRQAGLRLLQGLAGALDLAHRAGIVHGDLAPRQILVDEHRVLLSDLGLAVLRRPHPDGVTVAVPAASAPYAAPELVMGGEPTVATDVYAFATLAYHLLCGRTPFRGPAAEVLQAQLDEVPPPPSCFHGGIGHAADEVVLRGLDRDPGRRWPSCGELVTALEEALQADTSGQVALVPLVPPAVAPPPARRRRFRRWVVTAVALAAVATAAVAWSGSRGGTPASAPAIQLSLSASEVTAGGRVAVVADHLHPLQQGTVELHTGEVALGHFRADRRGRMRTTVTVPADTPIGRHLLTLCWNGSCHGSAWLRVLPPPATSSGPLPAPPASSPAPTAPQTGGAPRHRDRPQPPALTAPAPVATPTASAASGPTPLPTSRPTPSPSPSSSPTPSPTTSPSPSPSISPSISPSPSGSPTPSPSPSAGGGTR